MIGVKVGREIGRHVGIGDFESREIHLRSKTEIEHEFVAVAELDKPRRVCLRGSQEWSAGAERCDAHLMFRQCFGVWVIVVAVSRHGVLPLWSFDEPDGNNGGREVNSVTVAFACPK